MRRMRRSDDRILTTHAGSLPRPKALTELFAQASRGEAVDAATLAAQVAAATGHVVDAAAGLRHRRRQRRRAGARELLHLRARSRLSGFGGRSSAADHARPHPLPGFVELMLPSCGRPHVSLLDAPQAVGEVRHVDAAPLARELDGFAARSAASRPPRDAGSPRRSGPRRRRASSPAAMENAHYPSLEAYVDAVADALAPRVRGHRRTRATCCRSMRPISRWSATRSSPTARSTSSSASSTTPSLR